MVNIRRVSDDLTETARRPPESVPSARVTSPAHRRRTSGNHNISHFKTPTSQVFTDRVSGGASVSEFQSP